MGTKNNPGKFDCYHAAEPDEPMFIMLARDPLAGFLTSIWSSMRYGDTEAAMAKFNKMLTVLAPRYVATPDCDKASEALECAMNMFRWRAMNRPEDVPTPPATAAATQAMPSREELIERTFKVLYDEDMFDGSVLGKDWAMRLAGTIADSILSAEAKKGV